MERYQSCLPLGLLLAMGLVISIHCVSALDAQDVASQETELVKSNFSAIAATPERQAKKSMLGNAAYLFFGLAMTMLVIVLLRCRNLGKTIEKLEQSALELSREIQAAKAAADTAVSTKRKFLEDFNHEIRNPIQVIVSYCEFLTILGNNETSKERIQTEQYLDVIRKSIDQLLGVLENTLDDSRVESGQVLITKSKFVLSEMCSDLSLMVQGSAVRKGLQFSFKCNGNDQLIYSDESRIKQIVLTIIDMIVQSWKQGIVEVEMDYLESDELVLAITAFCPESSKPIGKTVNPLFGNLAIERFLGLGSDMNTINHLVKALGGKIEIERTRQTGLKISICLPIETPTQESTTVLFRQEKQARKILIVDDQPDVRDAIEIILQNQGCETKVAETVQDALCIVKEWNPDFVFLDLRMPNTDGFQYLAAIKGSSRADPFCVAVTGDATVGVRQKCDDAGFDGFLTKPIKIAKLRSLLGLLGKPTCNKFRESSSFRKLQLSQQG